MFQAVPPPIIRSSKLYIEHRVLSQNFIATCHCRGRNGTAPVGSSVGALYQKLYIVSQIAPEDGRICRPKHVGLN